MSHEEYDEDDGMIVVVKHEGVFGLVIEYGAHVSRVLYCVGGLMYEELMENDDFEPLEDEE